MGKGKGRKPSPPGDAHKQRSGKLTKSSSSGDDVNDVKASTTDAKPNEVHAPEAPETPTIVVPQTLGDASAKSNPPGSTPSVENEEQKQSHQDGDDYQPDILQPSIGDDFQDQRDNLAGVNPDGVNINNDVQDGRGDDDSVNSPNAPVDQEQGSDLDLSLLSNVE